MQSVSEEIDQALSRLQALRDLLPASEWPKLSRIQRLIEALAKPTQADDSHRTGASDQGEIIAYRLEPVRQVQEGLISTAALMTCMATGDILSGMGGGGEYLSPQVVETLRGGDCTIIKGTLPPEQTKT